MRCLDNRRLLGQHSETHILLSVLDKHAKGKPSGWSNGPQGRIWIGKRGAICRYHDDIVLPEMARRGWPSGELNSHASPVVLADIPLVERNHQFWPNVTWKMVLTDSRHIIEKHHNDSAKVHQARAHGIKTRVIHPQGHSEKAKQLTPNLAISRVFALPESDPRFPLLKDQLLNTRLLTPDRARA